MKNLKRLLPISLALSLALMTACSSDSGSSSSSTSGSGSSGTTSSETATPKEETIEVDFDFSDTKIGVVQLAEHPALDSATEGFVNTLVAAGMPQGNIEVQNAQGEQVNCSTIATKFVNDQVDLVLAVATPAAQAMAGATKDIPILATAVTDFEAAGLTADNISGVSDMGPIEAQIDLIKEIVPDASSIGILYCSSEDNSIIQADIASTYLQEIGLNPVIYTVAETSEVQAAATAASNSVDAIYIPTDNLLAQTMPTVALVTNPAKIPVICGESGMVDSGGLATLGVDYYNLGKQTAMQAIQVLAEGVDIATIDVEFAKAEDLTPHFNADLFTEFELEVPASLS